jgi:signal transduction histidine kinase
LLSRVRLAGVGLVVGVGLVGAMSYGLLHAMYMRTTIQRTLGPYSDTLAEHVFEHPDPELWRRVARTHRVMLRVEPKGGPAVVFDAEGRLLERFVPPGHLGMLRAVRTGPDGTRVTLYWTLWSFRATHFPLLAGSLTVLVSIVGATFWFVQRQLRPLRLLQHGVEAVARGDLSARVPVVRNDEIGEVARSFNDMTGRVREMIDDRERLLADVSHELRSPIARMKVALELLPEGGKRDGIARDLREMESLIAVLLEREELRSRAGRIVGQPVELDQVVRDAAAAFADRRPRIDVVAGSPVMLEGQPALIKLLVHNLLDNAIKFSLPESAPIVVRTEKADGQVVLRVADDGIGIPAGSEERVFEPFVKLDRARGHHAGYGIGLDLCRRIVQLHGGSIRLVRRTPRGTEAIVTLPEYNARTPTQGDSHGS